MLMRPFQPARRALGLVALLVAFASGCGSCSHGDATGDATPEAVDAAAALPPMPAADAGPPAQQGMVWIPGGTLIAGTPIDAVPRIAEEELPGTKIAMNGFYIDQLPYPDESGAIPTSNVSRDDAAEMCASKGKRLCTELEWERACKGPRNTAYEYGDAYRPDKCGTGVTAEEAARRPSGDRVGCKSGFGVLEMHGGAWEWTSSSWGRGKSASLGVLRGGNAVAGELAGRCANGIGREPTHKAPTMSFRCCKGEVNAATVDLKLVTGRALQPMQKSDAARVGKAARSLAGVSIPDNGGFHVTSAWTWRPVPNEVLTVASGCAEFQKGRPIGCALVVFRPEGERDRVLTGVGVDVGISEMAVAGEARHIRVRGLRSKGGLYARDITYAYGQVEIGEEK